MVTPHHLLTLSLVGKSRGQSNHIGCLKNTLLPEHIADTFAESFSTVFNDNTHTIPDFTLQDSFSVYAWDNDNGSGCYCIN